MNAIATRGQMQAAKLWDRVVYAKSRLEPIQTQYCVAFEDPHREGDPVSVLHPDPNWMAMALHGNIVPTIDAYLGLPLIHRYERNSVLHEVHVIGMEAARLRMDMQAAGWTYLGEKVDPSHKLHTAEVMPPMTERQAVEYLLMKGVPYELWSDTKRRNRRAISICRKDQLPTRDEHRNAWRLKQ